MTKLRCPNCAKKGKNTVLFIQEIRDATIEIKCPKCKAIITIERNSHNEPLVVSYMPVEKGE